MIYLNNASQTKVKPEVIEVITDILQNHWGNESDMYNFGLESKRILEESRVVIANAINAEPEEIYFTASGSMANALAINGYLHKHGGFCIISNIEHSSIIKNANPYILKVHSDYQGFINKTVLEEKLRGNDKSLVSIMYANNEIGSINDIKSLCEIAHKYNCIFHTDAVQYFPYYNIDVKDIGVDMLSFSGHKIGAPSGIGVLYIKKGINLSPIVPGTQEDGLIGGTRNIAYIAGLAKAVELIDYSKTKEIEYKRNYLWDKLLNTNLGTSLYLNGTSDWNKRLSNNLNFQIVGVDNQQLIALLDMNKLCVSAGSACCSGESKPSHVLKAIGLNDKEANESIRVTLSEYTTFKELDIFVDTLKQCIKMLL